MKINSYSVCYVVIVCYNFSFREGSVVATFVSTFDRASNGTITSETAMSALVDQLNKSGNGTFLGQYSLGPNNPVSYQGIIFSIYN